MSQRLINIALFVSSLICYLEWPNNSGFLFQMEYEVFGKALQGTSVMHPLIILPLIGQIILLITIFQKTPGKVLTLIAIGLLGLLIVMIFIVGIFGLNVKILASTIPFFVLSVISITRMRKRANVREVSG